MFDYSTDKERVAFTGKLSDVLTKAASETKLEGIAFKIERDGNFIGEAFCVHIDPPIPFQSAKSLKRALVQAFSLTGREIAFYADRSCEMVNGICLENTARSFLRRLERTG
jgi:hypothetical protein